jgi:hypothetical protein
MSANLAQGVSPDISTPPRKCAVGFEDTHRYALVEYGAIIAPDGRILYQRKGTANSVTFSPLELSLVGNITFTHNHPHRHSFSVHDIELAVEYQMREMRAVTTAYRYFASGFAGVDLAKVAAEHQAHAPYAEHATLGRVIAGSVHLADLSVESTHATWERVSAALGFHYTREQS